MKGALYIIALGHLRLIFSFTASAPELSTGSLDEITNKTALELPKGPVDGSGNSDNNSDVHVTFKNMWVEQSSLMKTIQDPMGKPSVSEFKNYLKQIDPGKAQDKILETPQIGTNLPTPKLPEAPEIDESQTNHKLPEQPTLT